MKLSLQKKFIIVAFLAVLLLTAVISFLAAVRTRSALLHASEKQGLMLAQTVSALIINELIYEKLGLVEEGGLIDNYVRELYQRRELDLKYVAVLDTSLQVISHSDFGEFGKRYSSPLIEEARLSGTIMMKKTIAGPAGIEEMEFAAPLAIEGKHWGVLLFSLSLEGVEREIRAMILQIITLSLMSLCFLFILIYFLSRRFIKPIIDLAEAMGEVEVEMREKTMPVAGSDELSRLVQSYNDMVRRIRRANEEMKLAHEKLLQSEKLATLGVLASSVAHRINNPLGGLFNCVRLLQRQGDDPGFRNNYLELILEGLESIEKTVGQLLYTAGRRDGEEKRSEVAAVLARVLKFLDYRMKKQEISYVQEVTDGLVIPVAPHDLEEMLLNTMINSIQAMESGGTLQVNAGRGNEQVEIRIEDTGTGIPEDRLDQVFDLFYSTKKAGEGTGLGMWMTYELVKKYRGHISLESREGVGTKVSIVIPEGT
ncbi:MAG: HAMP domain-containing protein [Proteobacteria bacterium]|nr:HAMP domain-containing protein [Pseudomonadota bacterium]